MSVEKLKELLETHFASKESVHFIIDQDGNRSHAVISLDDYSKIVTILVEHINDLTKRNPI